ncbi:unnamed protein product [Prorocentrum cordatum]|uniref:Uncharacterized protein n=1 Tax=Prorocentrum cordatum TaxID=2364126 RepID=A0ABN9SFK9_9DINO|nr:unnamed protein product [Polarella glacialis]
MIDIFWVIEQPLSSLFNYTCFFQRLVSHCKAGQVTAWLGAYGSSTPKPIKLFFTTGWGGKLRRTKPSAGLLPSLVQCVVTEEGFVQVNGRHSQLRTSSAYPGRFGTTVAVLARMQLMRIYTLEDANGPPLDSPGSWTIDLDPESECDDE